MIGVMRQESGVGEIRRLRVRTDARRRGIGAKLLEAAVQFCKDHQYLKIRLDTYMDREPAIHLFEKFKFRHSRTRDLNGKQLLYFYLDLYSNELPAARRRE
jgi:ribosomal protein S18 acetylase RimI-like enzyme